MDAELFEMSLQLHQSNRARLVLVGILEELFQLMEHRVLGRQLILDYFFAVILRALDCCINEYPGNDVQQCERREKYVEHQHHAVAPVYRDEKLADLSPADAVGHRLEQRVTGRHERAKRRCELPGVCNDDARINRMPKNGSTLREVHPESENNDREQHHRPKQGLTRLKDRVHHHSQLLEKTDEAHHPNRTCDPQHAQHPHGGKADPLAVPVGSEHVCARFHDVGCDNENVENVEAPILR
mmetsp:Transcript_39436/g.108620  ORF Transcript_39436/g.108620 Transcript_39436/m.108620 type:complete len:241 (+) Transcript_39436:414-1136(+)